MQNTMSHAFHPGQSLPYGQAQTSPWELLIRQAPERGKMVVKGKEKDRKPVDPPPIIQLNNKADPTFLHNPYLFIVAYAWHETEHRQATHPDSEGEDLLIGQTVSSLHRLKDLDNAERGLFVFGDLSLAAQGRFRLRFCLWEYNLNFASANFLGEITTAVCVDVSSAKDWDGIHESTVLSRTVADQGIKLRLRKESRHPRGRAIGPSTSSAPSASSTPIRPNPTQGGSYGSVDGSNEASEPAMKRQRSSGAESSTGGGASSANTTPYVGYSSGTTNTGNAYHGYQTNISPQTGYPSNYQTPSYGNPTFYGGSMNTYPFNPNYSMNTSSPSAYGNIRAPAGSYNPSSYSTNNSPSYQQQMRGSYYGVPDYQQQQPQHQQQQQQHRQQQRISNPGYGTPTLPSISTSSAMSNPGSAPHLAPMEPGQGPSTSGAQLNMRYGSGGYGQG